MFVILRAPAYANLPGKSLRHVLQPPIDTGHFAVMRQGEVPRAFASWAYLDADTEARHLRGEKLNSQDWMSGSRLWLMDIVAPYGQRSGLRMLRYFEQTMLKKHQTYQCVRPGKRTGEFRHLTAIRQPDGRITGRRAIHPTKLHRNA